MSPIYNPTNTTYLQHPGYPGLCVNLVATTTTTARSSRSFKPALVRIKGADDITTEWRGCHNRSLAIHARVVHTSGVQDAGGSTSTWPNIDIQRLRVPGTMLAVKGLIRDAGDELKSYRGK